MVAFDAIVLAGGRSSRMGDIDKVGVVLGGRTLLAHACEAASDAVSLVVVGPTGLDGTPEHAIVVREDPPFGGPAAALGAGLAALDRRGASPWVVVLAADMPHVAPAVQALLSRADRDGVIAVTSDGHRQPLCALYRTAALRDAVRAHAPLSGKGVMAMTRGLDLIDSVMPDEMVADIDTIDDLRRQEQQHG